LKSYEASADIKASPEQVWAVLTDAAGYSRWDSGVVRVEGTIAPGNTIKVFSSVSPNRAFPVKVSEFRPVQAMRWSGGMPLGLFKGVRTFRLTPNGGTTRFEMREEFTGPMLPLIWRSMPDLGPSFAQFATGLKARAEAGEAGSAGSAG
jgi:hypothetical protein